MGLSEDLLRLKEEATANFAAAAAAGAAAVEAVRIALMGRSGKLKDLEEGFAAALRSGTASEGLAAMSAKRPATWVVRPDDATT